uniref:HNH endonuclease n=1 Tax=Pithovirus LCPAC406 TaxID=2506599 RepID=A0A481ZH34_9VIRU|nr:MAG: HNH endonuclease [Pithovirus LCPAC406]
MEGKHKYRCGTNTAGGSCIRLMRIKGDKCHDHKHQGRDPAITSLIDENDNFNVNKFFLLTELKQNYCTKCEKSEEWRSMKCHISEMYILSSLGRCWSFRKNKLLKGGDNDAGKYRAFKLTDDNGTQYRKGVHTWLGIKYFGLPFLDKDTERNYKEEITVDHIDFKKTKDNFVCCNLRPSTKSKQAENRTYYPNKRGKTVFKLSLEGNFIKEFISIEEAAKEMKVSRATIMNRCRNDKALGEFKFRYKVKFDFGDLIWMSTSKLFQDNDVLEVSSEGHICREDGIISKGSKNGDYLGIQWRNSKTKKYFGKYMNVLVWETFHNQRVQEDYQIHHKDGKPWNNNIENLVKVTRSENIQASINSGKNKGCKKVRRIAHDGTCEDFVSLHEAARKTDKADPSSISKCLKKKRKTCGKCKCGKRFTWSAFDESNDLIL